MKVEGKDVEALKWLKETGGRNAIKRFSNQTVSEGAGKTHQGINAESSAVLKAQTQYAIADQLSGGSAGTTALDMLNELAQKRGAVVKTNDPQGDSKGNSVLFTNIKANNVTVNGTANAVNFHSQSSPVRNNTVMVNGEGNQIRGYNGGQTGNSMDVAGDANRVFAGEGVSRSTVTVEGNENIVNLGTEASNNQVTIAGNNSKITIGTQGLNSGSNQNWKINVQGNNVEVNIFNGKVDVKMAEEEKNKYKITIDEIKKSVEITLLGNQLV